MIGEIFNVKDGCKLRGADAKAVIDRSLKLVAAVEPFRLPLLRAAYVEGTVGFCQVMRDPGTMPAIALNPGGPMVMVIGDDDLVSTGPAGFRDAQRFAEWADAAMVHAAGGEALHYQMAVDGALRMGRLLLVETSSAHASAWCDLFGKDGELRIPVLCIYPREGAHPTTADVLH